MHLKLRTQCALEIMVVVHDDYDYDYYYYSNLGFAQIEHQCSMLNNQHSLSLAQSSFCIN